MLLEDPTLVQEMLESQWSLLKLFQGMLAAIVLPACAWVPCLATVPPLPGESTGFFISSDAGRAGTITHCFMLAGKPTQDW